MWIRVRAWPVSARDVGVGVAQEVDRDPGHQVEVLLAVLVVEQAALAAHEGDRQPPAGLHEVLLGELGSVGIGLGRDHRADAGFGEELEQQARAACGRRRCARAARRRARAGTPRAWGSCRRSPRPRRSSAARPPCDSTATTSPSTPSTPGTSVRRMSLCGVERHRDLGGDGVGVDVVGVAVVAQADRRDDRDVAAPEQRGDRLLVDLGDAADEAQRLVQRLGDDASARPRRSCRRPGRRAG